MREGYLLEQPHWCVSTGRHSAKSLVHLSPIHGTLTGGP